MSHDYGNATYQIAFWYKGHTCTLLSLLIWINSICNVISYFKSICSWCNFLIIWWNYSFFLTECNWIIWIFIDYSYINFFSNVPGIRYDTFYFLLIFNKLHFHVFPWIFSFRDQELEISKAKLIEKKPPKQKQTNNLFQSLKPLRWTIVFDLCSSSVNNFTFSDRTGPITVVSIHIWGACQTLVFAHTLRFALLSLLCSDSDI